MSSNGAPRVVRKIDENFQDRRLDTMQRAINDLAAKANAAPGAQSFVSSQAFDVGGTTTWHHGLGRIPVRWSVEDVTGGYGSFQRTAWNAQTISIKSANACTATIRVEVQ